MSSAVFSHPYISLPEPVVVDAGHSRQYECSIFFKHALQPGHLDWSVPTRIGLPTPPSEMNSVAYNRTFPSSYGPQAFSSSVHRYSDMPSKIYDSYTSTPTVSGPNCEPDVKAIPIPSTNETPVQKQPEELIASYLQIPSTINKSKGSLAEFAAQIACLFWFEETAKLKMTEESTVTTYALVPEAIPSIGFQKWVTTILSTTQVSQNVILLALLFIYRLKKFNPRVRGKKGSEFRLMTIALMMGNKFLDDNTYTNKTWAEVSGISVQEIHIMEVEFLSNVRYNLFVSKTEWQQWHIKLGLFAEFFEKAFRMPRENELNAVAPILQISPVLVPTGRTNQPVSPLSKLPSPGAIPPVQFQPDWNAPHYITNRTISPPRPSSELQLTQYSKKRSWDHEIDEHPAKRVAVSNAYPTPAPAYLPPTTTSTIPILPPVLASVAVSSSIPAVAAPVPRLPRPASFVSNSMLPTIPSTVSPLHLPTTRVMSTAYSSSATWSQQVPSAVVTTPTSAPLFNGALALPDPGRSQTQLSNTTETISPTNAVAQYSLPSSHSNLSPSFFLVNRNSPYRPVRAVNTLLIPPPSASLHQPRTLSMQQMHYQPLGKTLSERRAGVLPYLHHEAWPQGHISQPNFLSTQGYHN